MQRVRVKIEGLRDPETALRIAQMGADAIGVVFAESPRWVSPEQARTIVEAMPPWVSVVGVFVNDDAETINRVVRRTGITHVQLHGDEAPELIGQVDAPCIKAFGVRGPEWIGEVHAFLDGCRGGVGPAAILLDAYNPSARGGPGERVRWAMVADARAGGALRGVEPIILAGGLDADCVGNAIDLVQPWAVDVASGVEKAPGVKDLKKVEAFLRASEEGSPLRTDFWR